MGGSIFNCLPSLWLSFSFCFFFIHFCLLVSFSQGQNGGGTGTNQNANITTPPPQSQPSKGSAFKPSIAVIVGVLTTIFSVTFLLLLYIKHCRRGDTLNPFTSTTTRGYPPLTDRKNSGIDRAVIDSLPIFRFASLRGQKDGLECAVCLNRFESTEVLRLLPKCKHAFHVECVDTWLDAHSTCPLCRYRVDPEDILLVEDNRILYRSSSSCETPQSKSAAASQHPTPNLNAAVSRVSGRHSFAGNSLEVIVETPKVAVSRRSLDSWSSRKKRRSNNSTPTSNGGGNGSGMVDVGCLDRPRKDELLLGDDKRTNKGKAIAPEQQRRLEHRIIISADQDGPHHRWSDVHPSDLLFLQSEKILSDSRRYPGSTRGFYTGEGSSNSSSSTSNNNSSSSTADVINGPRSVSEITGMSRFRSNDQSDCDCDGDGDHDVDDDGGAPQRREKVRRKRVDNWKQRQQEEQRKRQEGAVSRWMAWISQSHFHQRQQPHQPAVHGTLTTSTTPTLPPPDNV